MAEDNADQTQQSDYRIGPVLFRRIWRLVVPYWRRKRSWPSWCALAFLLLSAAIVTRLIFLQTFFLKDLTNALIERQPTGFWTNFGSYAAFAFIIAAAPSVMQTVDSWLGQHWRGWLTNHLVGKYLANRTYYDINLTGDLDNPDQRIQECVTPFTKSAVETPRLVIYQVGVAAAGLAVLTTLDRRLIMASLAIILVQVFVMYLVYIPTVRKNFDKMVAEADLRYGLLHIRDNAEAIAFYEGENNEREHTAARVANAVRRNLKLQYYTAINISGTATLFVLVWTFLPYLLLAPLVLGRTMSYGSLAQGVAATMQILQSMQILIAFLPVLADAAPQAVRLAQIQERFDALEAGRAHIGEPRLTITRTEHVSLRDVSLETPGGEQQLVRHVTLSVEQGEHLVIVGQTGVGKSSLLRAMAGLWTRGHGEIGMPSPDRCLFLPQRPYMVLDNLRSQLLYPHVAGDVPDAKLEDLLRQADLPDLLQKHGGLDAVKDWSKILSLGEQQRIGFARVLVSQPAFVFLDEATSAVDYGTEQRLYEMLRLTGASYISIGHRLSILDHHTHALTLAAGGGWSIAPTEKKQRERNA